MERRKFTREFKLEAVRLIKDRGVSYAQASQDLNVHTSQLRDWVKKFSDDPEQAFPGNGQMKPEQLEIAQLKREVAKLKAERDILKKAAAYFAKESTRLAVPLADGRDLSQLKCAGCLGTALVAKPRKWGGLPMPCHDRRARNSAHRRDGQNGAMVPIGVRARM